MVTSSRDRQKIITATALKAPEQMTILWLNGIGNMMGCDERPLHWALCAPHVHLRDIGLDQSPQSCRCLCECPSHTLAPVTL
jgi:hypothetical protein